MGIKGARCAEQDGVQGAINYQKKRGLDKSALFSLVTVELTGSGATKEI